MSHEIREIARFINLSICTAETPIITLRRDCRATLRLGGQRQWLDIGGEGGGGHKTLFLTKSL